ncbi:leucine-rich repeat-containing protein 27-like [Fopius arisanus]|uniref:LRRC27 protein n=1 Tax=Fopius arisanus TaxID=64838 RepID=A0A0C9RNN7_9HYME|nr:PREDICTED: leucine-rich repeat-containing protein 27-like [Fopius arisanus]
MENLTQNLLSNYYGLGGARGGRGGVASHEGFQRELTEERIVDDVDGHFNGEDLSGGGENPETQIEDLNEGNGAGDGLLLPWRVFAEEDNVINNIIDDEVDLEVDLEVENSRKDVQEEGKIGLPKLIIPEKGDGRDESSELGVADDGIPDSASDVSTMSTKKKTRKKSRLSTAGVNDPQPLILMPPISKKNLTINKEFCDMTDASITEFPVNLLEELSSIRMLYLDNNCLNELPEELFMSLSFLQWLDVRNNWLKTLPGTIKNHQCLETILLQGNRIEKLPLELCLIPNLKTLQTAGNPLTSPPPGVIAQGFTSILNFLMKEWNMQYPNDPVPPTPEVKSTSTILCDDPPVINSSRSSRLLSHSSTSSLIKAPKAISSREKSRNYRPSNRCRSSGGNSVLEEKLRWISKVRDMLIKQAADIQRIKDRETLREWRRDGRSFNTSMRKAASRTQEGIPFDIDTSDTPFLTIKKLEKPMKASNRMLSEDMDKKMFDIMESLQQTTSRSSNSDVQLNLLHSEIKRITTLYEEIQALKRQNDTSYKKYTGPIISSNPKRYDPPPSIII